MTKGWILAAAAAIFMALAVAGTASAQYPTPKGNIVCTTVVNVEINQTYVSATLRDSTGKTMANAYVDFWIVSGPGQVSSSSVATDASGTATVTLIGGGNTVVGAGYDGVECRAVNQVLGQTFRPPSTGDGGLADGDSRSKLAFGACLLVMGVSGAALALLRRRGAAVEIER